MAAANLVQYQQGKRSLNKRLPFFLQDSTCPLPYNLSLDQIQVRLLRKTNMYALKLHRCLTFTTLLALLSAPLAAKEIDQLGWIGVKEEWGQVLFCQRIYKMPEVKTRLYSFDIEQCDKAGLLMADVVTKYSKEQQLELKNQAERHSTLLSRNTSEPYQSVTACRAFCKELADIQDKRND